jgi:predicted MFS family arabinose efflux permease
MRSFSRAGLGAVTAATMATATFPIIVASVLAAELIDRFGIGRSQVGLLVTATALVGALASPLFGRITDRIGAVAATRNVLALGIVTLTAFALAPSYGFLVVAAIATGIPNGWSNPATNSLIVDNVPAGSRGIVTGVKQSGVQFGTFLGGMLLPLFATLWDWRAAVLVFLMMPVAGLVGMMGRTNPIEHETQGEWAYTTIPVEVKWVAVYGTFSGLATSALFGFLPLFAEENQLWSARAAGSLVAVVGLSGIAARILWPAASERRIGHGRTLRILAVMSMVTAALLALSALGVLESWVLIPASVLLGGGAIAWNAVGMLAVMDFSPPGMVGKGTGVVLAGFLLGLAFGAPLMGLSVDTLGTYVPGWLASAGLLGGCVVVAGKIPAGGTVAHP